MNTQKPVHVTIGVRNDVALSALRRDTALFREESRYARPIHIHAGRGLPFFNGYECPADLLGSACAHAKIVRADNDAEFGVGIAYGSLYIPADSSPHKRCAAIETILVVACDSFGVCAWAMPREAVPPDCDFLRGTIGEIFTILKTKRTADNPAENGLLLSWLLPNLIKQIRPLHGIGRTILLH